MVLAGLLAAAHHRTHLVRAINAELNVKSIKCQLACKPGSVWSCLRDGHSSGTPIAGRLKQPTRMAGLETGLQAGSCTGWGLPCQRRYRSRGALLPHRFTLTLRPEPSGGLFSVALSLGSPPAAVSRHPVSMEPGLSSTSTLYMGHNAPSGSDRPAN